ncbi:hypothetical protein ASE65_08190 [Sphingomonas sp. Leaf16]|nr:hypothetical protein ASE65_08190 [Sphingomonas sp. Leaf16]KQN12591.1 hypothetical protein ASE81_09200 [Sphingomonas sp. Leaf29]KQN19071.1 hypothetical protein ASE83_09125 [Sphingomonas sp. Leaf32]
MALAAGAMMLAACSKAPSIDDAWVRLPAVPGRPAVAYATITGGSVDVELTTVSTPAARRVELHRSMTGGHGMATMQPLQRLPVAKDRTVQLAPGGIHAMLFDPAPNLQPGGWIKLTFDFDGSEQTVDARLVGAGDPAPE